MKQIIVDNISTWYYITEDGKCYNEKTNNWLKGQENKKNGYFSYNITLPDGKKKRLYAHRLVAIAYIPNDDKNKNQINHKDGNKLNNHIENLEWVTHKENARHMIEKELKVFPHVYCFNKDKVLVAEYKSIAEAAHATHCCYTGIQAQLKLQKKSLVNGFYWNDKSILEETINYKNTGKAKPVNQYDLNGRFIMSYPSTGIAARAIRGKYQHIGECCRGKINQYYGFVWRYVEDIVSPSMKVEENMANINKINE